MTPEEVEIREKLLAQLSAYLAKGVAPDDVGRMVLAGVKANRLYILTDRLIGDPITARTKALLDAMPASS
jgi:hypothetical protein